MRIINAESVAKCLPYDDLIEKLRVAFTQDTFAPERTNHTIKNTQDSASSLLLMPAWKHEGSIGIKIVSVFPENTANNLSAVHANYILMSAKDGLPKAIMEPVNVTAPMAVPIVISIRLPSLILPGNPRLKATGFKKADIATKTAASPTRL